MPNPLFVFAFVVATLLGAGFHVLVGGNARRLAIFLLAAWAGFSLGQAAGQSVALSAFMIGPLHLDFAIGGALFALIAALIFTTGRRQRRPGRR